MNSASIVVAITRSIVPEGVELLHKNGFKTIIHPALLPPTETELHLLAKNADALITMLSDKIDASFLERHKHLKVISNYAVGFNNIDIKKASELKIPIGNTPDVLTEATAEVALGLMISAARNFSNAQMNAKQGEWKTWEPKGFLGHGLKNKTLGIIGMGRIGLRLKEMASAAFSMKILSLPKDYTTHEYESFFKSIDFLSIHAPLTSKTLHFINKDALELMKPSAVVINTARGEIIDQDALYEALSNKTIFAAGLDVTSPEPLEKEHPLYQLKNVIILPHIASATYEARRQMSEIVAKNIISGVRGELETGNFVNIKDLLP